MPNDMQNNPQTPRTFIVWRVPLFRLLAINLAAGVALAALLVGGLRDLIFADESPIAALGLLLFGFVVTFGSAAMGSAIMAAGLPKADDKTPRGPRKLVAQELTRTVPR